MCHPLAQELEQRRQFLAPLGAGAGYLLRSDYSAAGGGEGIKLDGKVLIDGADASISDNGHRLVERFLETNHMQPCRKVAFHKENAHLRRSADMIRIKEALY